MTRYVKKVGTYCTIKLMAYRIIYLISFFFILSLSINPAIIKAENGSMGSIQGTITDQNGLPLANIEILVAELPDNLRLYTPYPWLFPPWATEEEVATMISDYYPGRYNNLLYGSNSLINPTLPPIHRTTSSADGQFLLSHIPPGKYSLWAYDPLDRGYIPAIFGIDEWSGPGLKDRRNREQEILNRSSSNKNIPLRVRAGEIAGSFDLVLKMGGTVEGRITDADDGAPIAGAKIGVTAISGHKINQSGPSSVEYRVVTSDSEGNFIFSGLPQGEYKLAVREVEGYIIEDEYYSTWYYGSLEEEAESSSENMHTVMSGQVTSGCTIRLHRGAEIFGRVTKKADGEPIADVEVRLMEITSDFSKREIKTRSQSDGTYRITGLEAGAYIPLVQDIPGFQGMYYPATRDKNRAQEFLLKAKEKVGPIDFQLPPISAGGTIKGQIIEEGTGMPLSGIKIVIYSIYVQGDAEYWGDYYPDLSSRMNLPPLNVDVPYSMTDSEGRFEFVGLESGKYSLYASDPTGTYLPSYFPTIGDKWPAYRYLNYYIKLSENQEIDDITLPLQRGGCIQGRVTDGAEALAGAFVVHGKVEKSSFPYPMTAPMVMSPGIMSEVALTDTEGNFELCGLEEGEYVIWAEDAQARGYKPTFYSRQENNKNKPLVLTLPPGATLTDMTIAMETGATLSGTITDSVGNPLADMPVEIYLKDPLTLFFEYIGHDIAYPYPASEFSVYTGKDGRYTLTGLFDGEYDLMVNIFDSKYLSNCYSGIPISSSDINTADIVLSIGGVVTGKVTDTNGEPLSGIMVSIMYDNMSMFSMDNEPDPSTWSVCSFVYTPFTPANPVDTAEDGTYRIKGIRGGDYRISASEREGVYLTSDYPLGSVAVVEGEETSHIDITLAKGGIIKGTIRDQATGNPVSGAIVLAENNPSAMPAPSEDPEYDEYGLPPWMYFSQMTAKTYYSSPSDNEGSYTIHGLAEGSYVVHIESENSYQPQYYSGASSQEEAHMVSITSAQVIDMIDFTLIQGMSLEGRVRDAVTGDVIAKGCTITLMDEQMKVLKNINSDYLGNYKFTGLPPGTYYVQVEDSQGEYYQGGYHGEGIIITQSISQEGIDVSLSPKGSLSGTITDEYDLTPCGNLIIIAIPADYDPRTPASYGAPDPYAGSYPLPDTPSAEPSAFDIAGSSPMGYGGGGPSGAYGMYPQLQCATTDENGRYTVKNLDEGDYRILVLDPAYIYEGEYYMDVSPAQWEEATIIHMNRSENRDRIDMRLHVGEIYSEKNEYPYSLLKDYQPTLGYFGATSEAFSYQSSGGGGGSASGNMGVSYYQLAAPLEILSEADSEIAVGRSFIYQVRVSDVDPEISLRFALQKKPAGMTIDPESGLIEWQPTNDDKGSHIVQVQVSAGSDQILYQSAYQSFRLEVVEDRIPQAPMGVQPPLPLFWNYTNMNFWDTIGLRGNIWNFTTQNRLLGNNLSSWPW